MEKESVISSFVANRPEAIGAYGYGSGVFRQTGYSEHDNPQIDLIFLVEDLREWHLNNIRKNEDDYSLFGRAYVSMSSVDKLKGGNGITYCSPVYENGYRFKYGVMEEKDFLTYLHTWENFFVAGRFHKPVLEIKGNELEQEAINHNKRQAVLVAALLSPERISRKEFFKILCSLSYSGTPRMKVAENPHKVDNIVTGNYCILREIYELGEEFIDSNGDELIIDHSKALRHAMELPIFLLAYLYEKGYDITNIHSIKKGILYYLKEHNKKEEFSQSLETIKTNGIVRSTPYFLAKIKKRVVGK